MGSCAPVPDLHRCCLYLCVPITCMAFSGERQDNMVRSQGGEGAAESGPGTAVGGPAPRVPSSASCTPWLCPTGPVHVHPVHRLPPLLSQPLLPLHMVQGLGVFSRAPPASPLRRGKVATPGAPRSALAALTPVPLLSSWFVLPVLSPGRSACWAGCGAPRVMWSLGGPQAAVVCPTLASS